MRWDEMWDEIRWGMKSDVRWDEMRCDVRWVQMRWDEVKWDEMRWEEMRWDQMSWGEMWYQMWWGMRWDVRWDVRLDEMKWIEMSSCSFSFAKQWCFRLNRILYSSYMIWLSVSQVLTLAWVARLVSIATQGNFLFVVVLSVLGS
jgi:hypothetical protein